MILVVGATGRVGGNVTRRLLAQGKDVRILVRRDSPSEQLAQQGMATSARSLIEAGAKPVYGDLKDKASIEQAVRGVDTVVTTATGTGRGGDDNPNSVDLAGNHTLVDAAKDAGVRRFVFVSFLGADPNGPELFSRAKGQTEVYLKASGMVYTIIQPVFYMEFFVPMIVGAWAMSGQPVMLPAGGFKRHSMVFGDDVAAFVAAAVDNAAAFNETLAIGGPEALSWRDVAGVFERVLGHPIPVESVPSGQPVPGVPDAVQPLVANLENYDIVIPMDATARTFGVKQTTVEDFVRRTFGSAAVTSQNNPRGPL